MYLYLVEIDNILHAEYFEQFMTYCTTTTGNIPYGRKIGERIDIYEGSEYGRKHGNFLYDIIREIKMCKKCFTHPQFFKLTLVGNFED